MKMVFKSRLAENNGNGIQIRLAENNENGIHNSLGGEE